jgi:hypothetical protein
MSVHEHPTTPRIAAQVIVNSAHATVPKRRPSRPRIPYSTLYATTGFYEIGGTYAWFSYRPPQWAQHEDFLDIIDGRHTRAGGAYYFAGRRMLAAKLGLDRLEHHIWDCSVHRREFYPGEVKLPRPVAYQHWVAEIFVLRSPSGEPRVPVFWRAAAIDADRRVSSQGYCLRGWHCCQHALADR